MTPHLHFWFVFDFAFMTPRVARAHFFVCAPTAAAPFAFACAEKLFVGRFLPSHYCNPSPFSLPLYPHPLALPHTHFLAHTHTPLPHTAHICPSCVCPYACPSLSFLPTFLTLYATLCTHALLPFLPYYPLCTYYNYCIIVLLYMYT